ncbi:hypothetical protein EZL74_09435 [Flavobacterium silvisoli]|uniref:Uncharacterized protein n=1 Tax=Flavobacterium silvisoli TaxID=2529433 RepID=A0A4V2L4S0_9FLAO|nr:hypothetical protein [Flavobacterium silvisoli]TBX67485.1 hypothetical protein EZL74_09435 [Flavobacterium silvisoli]
MNTFIKIYTKGNKTIYLNISQIVKIEAGSDQGARIILINGDLVETSQKLDSILQILNVV